jgi:exonuclease III
MRVGSWNIDTNITRLEGGYAKDCFPEWRVNADNSESKENRIDRILDWIKKSNLDIIQIQESRCCQIDDEFVDSVTPIKNGLEHMGFKVLEHAYNPLGERCFITDGQKLKES